MSRPLPESLERVNAAQLCLARIVTLTEVGTVVVELTDNARTHVESALLMTADAATLTLHCHDEVLVWRSAEAGPAVIIGRVGESHGKPVPVEAPASLVLEAKQTLTLRVGDGSITIREDGKILIKGKDLVSHAQRLNRIKGGSVSIN
jgi:hypothetical protein